MPLPGERQPRPAARCALDRNGNTNTVESDTYLPSRSSTASKPSRRENRPANERSPAPSKIISQSTSGSTEISQRLLKESPKKTTDDTDHTDRDPVSILSMPSLIRVINDRGPDAGVPQNVWDGQAPGSNQRGCGAGATRRATAPAGSVTRGSNAASGPCRRSSILDRLVAG
jgi:hypothetical protein